MSNDTSKLDKIEDVIIDDNGKFKYVLIELNSGSSKKYIVRGFGWAEYHGMAIRSYFLHHIYIVVILLTFLKCFKLNDSLNIIYCPLKKIILALIYFHLYKY